MASERVLAAPPGECCTKTVQHAGDAVGVWDEISSLKTYVSYPPQKSETYDRIILFFTDVFSPVYINNQLISDWYASRGYLVLAPDYMEGDPVYLHREKPGFNLLEWVQPKRDRANGLVPPWLKGAKAKYGNASTKYFAVGHCFGGPDVLDLCATDWLAAGAFAHPAFLNEEHFEKAKKPLLLSCAEVDFTFPIESRRKAEDILVAKMAEYHIEVFAKVSHGFAIRCNLDVPHERWAKEKCAASVIDWFDRFSV
ncbi:hypothetical protein EWM64_g1110 [Hericium alpestre]|uniref:Dienelactone hydrolase domain-containing protein n=1 Tax=Hericium alpestre TaxID=135208 RepID=A0A4Z0A998_9AGAM|nr:hypothetical protein EWM64_g1110 [Hericium alpestre]